MLDVIDLFNEQDTRDELGISTVRDAFADLLFPGITTIQTRAKYFLFVPWIYRDLERKRVSSADIEAHARREEVRLIRELSKTDAQGVIGRTAQTTLQRLPSEVYWQGLGTLGIRRFPGSRSQYHRSLDAYYARERLSVRTHDGDLSNPPSPNWHPNIVEPPRDFPALVDLSLARHEAEYLAERVHAGTHGTLFSYLIGNGHATDGVDFPWHHPLAVTAPDSIRTVLAHAQNFSEAMHGSALLYNVMLAEAQPNTELRDTYLTWLDEWGDRMQARAVAHQQWDLQSFWGVLADRATKVPAPTQTFITNWIESARNMGADVADSECARDLIREREQRVKRGRARLENRSALEQWGGASGTAQLDYRWGVAQRIINDVFEGLHA